MRDLVEVRKEGLYCPAGDFHIDPWRPVPRAVITHAHGDHARSGSAQYWGAAPGLGLLRERLGADAAIEPVPYGQAFTLGEAKVSLHPAGHVLGSAQVRIEAHEQVWVASGDYKRDPDPTCLPFEPVPCDVFITEATFALPVYRWTPGAAVAAEILAWWTACKAAGETAVLFCYSLGKAQRVLAELALLADETVYLHGAMPGLFQVYRDAGVKMLPTEPVSQQPKDFDWKGRLVLAPPGAGGTPWMKRFTPYSSGFASGWMRVRGSRRRQAYDRGFVLSDHADWDGLLRSIRESGARRILATHGNTDALVTYLRAQGLDADALRTHYEGEQDEAAAPAPTPGEPVEAPAGP